MNLNFRRTALLVGICSAVSLTYTPQLFAASVDAIDAVDVYKRQRKIFYRTFIGICPQITKLRNKTITRIIHTIINIPNHILLGQSCPCLLYTSCRSPFNVFPSASFHPTVFVVLPSRSHAPSSAWMSPTYCLSLIHIWMRTFTILHLLDGVIVALVDNLLFLHLGMGYVVHQRPADTTTAAGINKAILRTGIEGILARYRRV